MSCGYRKYLYNIIPRIAVHPDVEAILCASPASINVKDWFHLLPNVKFINCRQFRFFRYFPDQDLKLQLEKFSPDVIFVPVERYFCFNDAPVVNMIQNMEPLVYSNKGNPLSEKLKNWLRARASQMAIKKSDRIIAVSEFVKDFLIERFSIPSYKIGIVYHGIDVPKENDCLKPSSIPKSWEGKFLFTAGSIRPARGLEDILWAMKHLVSQNIQVSGLVIAGETDPRMIAYQKKLKNWIQMHNLSYKVCWTGSLNEKEMNWCYKNCCVFIMTSRVESFGQIALEAMSHGCACVSADNPSLPEIFADAAIYYPPKDGRALAKAMQSVIGWDTQQRKKISEQSRERAAKFSWDVCAEKTITELAKVTKR